MSRSQCAVLLLVFASSGCSALIDPDPTRLGGGGGSGDAGAGTDARPVDGAGSDGRVEDADPPFDGGEPPRDARDDCADLPRCEGNVLFTCERGRVRMRDCDLGCAASGDRCAEFAPSNVDAELISDDAPTVELSGAPLYRLDTSECDPSMAPGRVVEQDDGGEVCVLQARSFRVGRETRLDVVGSRPLVILAADEIVIDGLIDLSARGTGPGPGGSRGGDVAMDESRWDGAGPFGGEAGEHNDPFADGGGGGGGFCGGGGDGGDAATETFASGGEGGETAPDDYALEPLFGGSGGGRGRGASIPGGTNAGLGGAGGGALQLSARSRIRIGGRIFAAGGGGLAGRADVAGNWGSGGGGGAGGAILLESPRVDLEPSAYLSVAGGGGGAGSDGSNRAEPGQDGALASPRALGGSSGTFTRAGSGGDGGGGDRLAGDDGVDGGASDRNGGGGGGGVGCIVVRNAGSRLDDVFDRSNPTDEPAVRVLRIHAR